MPGKDSKEPKDLGREWHSDGTTAYASLLQNYQLTKQLAATFEACPSDFSCLLMEETPPHGGDTLWCSGYEV